METGSKQMDGSAGRGAAPTRARWRRQDKLQWQATTQTKLKVVWDHSIIRFIDSTAPSEGVSLQGVPTPTHMLRLSNSHIPDGS